MSNGWRPTLFSVPRALQALTLLLCCSVCSPERPEPEPPATRPAVVQSAADREQDLGSRPAKLTLKLFPSLDTVGAQDIKREVGSVKVQHEVAGQFHGDIGRYVKQGLYAKAVPLLQRALTEREAALGQNHPEVAALLSQLGALYELQGLSAQAEPLLQRALVIQEAALGQNHPELAVSLNNLGILYMNQGLSAQAEPLLQRALAIQGAALGLNHPEVAASLNNLGLLYSNQGLYLRAETPLKLALAIREGVLGQDHPSVAFSLNQLGALYELQGHLAKASPLLQRALALGETSLGKDHPEVAGTLHNLGSLYAEQGLYEKAEPLLQRALAIWKKTLGTEHPNVAHSLTDLARMRFAQRRLAEAVPLFQEALTLSEKYLRREVYGFSEARLASVLRLLRADEAFLYGFARAHPGQADVRQLALSAALLRKGRSVEEEAKTSQLIYRGMGQEERELFERLRTLRTQLSTRALAGTGALSPAIYQKHLSELARQGDALEADLARRSAPLRALRELPPPSHLIDRVAAALPQDGALIEFVAYSDSPLAPARSDPPASQAPSQLRYLALVLFADGSTHALDLGPAEPIDHAALRLHEALARRTVSYQPAAQALYQLAFRPLEPLLGTVRRLFLSPDGQLSIVPFAALHDGHRFLIDAWDMTYVTSGKDLLRRSDGVPSASSVVVLADPDFSAPHATASVGPQVALSTAARSASLERIFSAERATAADQPWPPLPGTRKEAEAIQRLFPQAQVLLGSSATKEALLKLETPGILHLATHGFFLEDASAPPATRAVGHFGVIGSAPPPQPPHDPLLRSGLVLASTHASPPGAPLRGDSLVTALELAGLNLWGTQLVVLSACETGRGDIKLGQGVYGMRRALAIAGAETVVSSLWKIDDEATSQLMETYYGYLLAEQGRTTALRQAMQALRLQKPHPHFWAPFIALGQDAPLQGLAGR